MKNTRSVPEKIKNEKEIIRITARLAQAGKIVVTINGSFDLLHAGHVRSLNEAKAQGDVLVVLVNSDASVRSYKGPGRPIIPLAERLELLAALACVDYVISFDEINPKRILGRIRPRVHCNGSEWGRACVERSVVEEGGGRLHVLRARAPTSTSRSLEQIREISVRPEVRAVFLDRDGVINQNDPGYIHRREDFKFIPGSIPALRKLSKTGYKLIIATNQSGIGRGYFRRKDTEILHQWMVSVLKRKGIRIDAIYLCPHHPDAGCACRKPQPGMLLRAAKDWGINLSKSWFIGDDDRDVEAGREVNLCTIKLGGHMRNHRGVEPNFYARDLWGAARIIPSYLSF